MTPDELHAFTAAGAQAIGLTLSDAEIAGIAAQLAILFGHAENFSDFDLPPGLDPLTVFEP